MRFQIALIDRAGIIVGVAGGLAGTVLGTTIHDIDVRTLVGLEVAQVG